MYRWSIELEGIFVLPLAPRWVRHSYLSKEATIDPLYLWVIMPLGEFLDEQLARARENEITETDNIDESDDEDSPPRYELHVVTEGYVMDEETARISCLQR